MFRANIDGSTLLPHEMSGMEEMKCVNDIDGDVCRLPRALAPNRGARDADQQLGDG